MDNQPKSHLRIDGYNENLRFKYPKEPMGSSKVAIQNRAIHGQRLANQLDLIRQELQLDKEIELPNNIIRDDVIYVEFTSEWGFELAFKSLDKDSFISNSFSFCNRCFLPRFSQVIIHFYYYSFHIIYLFKYTIKLSKRKETILSNTATHYKVPLVTIYK